MVDRSDLAFANALNNEAAVIQQGIAATRMNPAITAMTLTVTIAPPATRDMALPGPETDEPELGPESLESEFSITVPTAGLVSPPQMISSIQQQLQSRYDAIVKQLTELGITIAAVPAAAARTMPAASQRSITPQRAADETPAEESPARRTAPKPEPKPAPKPAATPPTRKR